MGMPKSETPVIVPIVEGAGDKNAAPGLVRRILVQLGRYDIGVGQAKVTNGKPSLLKKFEQFLKYAIVDGCKAILVLVDADADCPLEEVPCLTTRAEALNLPVPVAIVYAKCEYETWFVCSLSANKESAIRKRLELPKGLAMPAEPEKVRDAKDWLTRHMPAHKTYKETADQEPLTHHIDLELVREKSRSFRRLFHAVEELALAVDCKRTAVTPRIGRSPLRRSENFDRH